MPTTRAASFPLYEVHLFLGGAHSRRSPICPRLLYGLFPLNWNGSPPLHLQKVHLAMRRGGGLCCIGIVGMPRSKRANDQTDTKRQKGNRTVTLVVLVRSTSVNPQTNFLWPSPPALLRGRRVRRKGTGTISLFPLPLPPSRSLTSSRVCHASLSLSLPLDIAACLTSICARAPIVFASYIHCHVEGGARSARVHNDHDFGTFCSCLE